MFVLSTLSFPRRLAIPVSTDCHIESVHDCCCRRHLVNKSNVNNKKLKHENLFVKLVKLIEAIDNNNETMEIRDEPFPTANVA